MTNNKIFTASQDDSGMRLDMIVSQHLPNESRFLIQMWIKTGAVTCNTTTKLKASHKIHSDDIYAVQIPDPVRAEPQAVKIDFDII